MQNSISNGRFNTQRVAGSEFYNEVVVQNKIHFRMEFLQEVNFKKMFKRKRLVLR